MWNKHFNVQHLIVKPRRPEKLRKMYKIQAPKNIDKLSEGHTLHSCLWKEHANVQLSIFNRKMSQNSSTETGKKKKKKKLTDGGDDGMPGHAERRHILKETNAMVARKAAFALSQGLSVVIAVGETGDERDLGLTNDVLVEQLQALVSKIADWSRVVLAYEPVWAIGTGRACSPDEAQAVHALIRDWMRRNTSEEVSVAMPGPSLESSYTCQTNIAQNANNEMLGLEIFCRN